MIVPRKEYFIKNEVRKIGREYNVPRFSRTYKSARKLKCQIGAKKGLSIF